MKLTQDQKNKVIQTLSSVLNSPCGVCHAQAWVLNDTIFELREFLTGGLTTGDRAVLFPVVAVLCRNCGNTLFFNAIQLGLVKKGK